MNGVKSKKKVRFSESIKLYFYPTSLGYDYGHSPCYNRKRASLIACKDAIMLKKLLLSRPFYEGLSLEEHLRKCEISKEMLVGLEHLVLQAPSRTPKIRRGHQPAIIMVQENLRKTGSTRSAERLAKLSATLSEMPAYEARRRAVLARAGAISARAA